MAEPLPSPSADAAAHEPKVQVTAWVLAGGEGLRMGGVDKGLQPWRGQPLAQWVLEALQKQADHLGVGANRNHASYAQLLHRACQASDQSPGPSASGPGNAGVHPDSPELPPRSGPLAGILTALRQCPSDWLQLAACDTPKLPDHLVERLLAAARHAGADIAVPVTEEPREGALEERPHWTCALIHKRVTPDLAAAFVKGERKVGQWIRSQRWVTVSFTPACDFENMNTLETLEAADERR